MLRRFFVVTVFVLVAVAASAVAIKRSPAFRAGETLECVFYFNWKFIWVKAGGAKLIVRDTIYNGQPAQYMSLLSSTNEAADAFFPMRDTLTTIFTKDDITPLYYRKVTVQGSRRYLNQVWYNYLPGNKVRVEQLYDRTDRDPVRLVETHDRGVYDMMSLLAYARTIDFSGFKRGQRINYPVATGRRVENQCLIYRGKKRIEASDGREYDCIEVSLVARTDKNKEKTIITFYVTDDKNHLPILLDLALNFGSAKAKLSKHAGLLYPLSPVKK